MQWGAWRDWFGAASEDAALSPVASKLMILIAAQSRSSGEWSIDRDMLVHCAESCGESVQAFEAALQQLVSRGYVAVAQPSEQAHLHMGRVSFIAEAPV